MKCTGKKPEEGVPPPLALVDYLTKADVDFLDPESISNAIKSGAIGKGSILTPLIHCVPKIHVRHLRLRAVEETISYIAKELFSDGVLFETPNRLGLKFHSATWENLKDQSNYVITDNVKTWLRDLPSGIPIFLHFDLDYFNNRFNGASDWKEAGRRSFDPRWSKQNNALSSVFTALADNNLVNRIINSTIGISPGFYPAEYWKPMLEALKNGGAAIGLNLNLFVNQSVKNEVEPAPMKRKLVVENKAPSPKKAKTEPGIVDSNEVTIHRLASKKFEGWKVKVNGATCGKVQFFPKEDENFNKHATVDFKISETKRGKHIGRIALSKAVEETGYKVLVAHLRKGNIASKKALEAVGFKVTEYPGRQLCMILKIAEKH